MMARLNNLPRWLTGVFTVLALALAAPAVDSPEEAQLFELVRQQAAALQREDIAAVMATIHPDSPLRAATQALLEKSKRNYQLRYTVSDLSLQSISPEEALVSFTQTTEKESGLQFRPTRLQGTHVFRKNAAGAWKFFDTKVVEVKYLDKAEPQPEE